MTGYMTTGEAAAVLRVSVQAAISLFDRGHLAGFRTPGSGGKPGHRRVCRASVERLRAACGIPLPGGAAGADDNGVSLAPTGMV